MKALGVILFIGALALSFVPGLRTLSLKTTLNIAEILEYLFVLAVIATLVERTIEVVFASFRTPQRIELENAEKEQREKRDTISRTIAAVEEKAKSEDCQEVKDLNNKRQELAQEQNQLYSREKAIAEFKAATAKSAGWIALVIGILVSVAGIRMLGQFVNASGITGFQEGLFRLLDVFITGGLIAGGSKVIHQVAVTIEDLFKAFRNPVR